MNQQLLISKIESIRDSHSSLPVYLRIRKAFEELILSGELPDGYRLPSDRKLSVLLNITHITLGKALNDLRSQGLLGRNRSLGTFVKAPADDSIGSPGEKSKLVAVIFDDANREVFQSEFFVALHDQLLKIDKEMLFLSSAGQKSTQFEQLKKMLQHPNCCGCLVWSLLDSARIRELMRIKPIDFPLIFLNSYHRDAGYDSVLYDGYRGGEEIGRMLIGMGYRKFLYLARRHRMFSDSHYDRLHGLQNSIAEKNLNPEAVTAIFYNDIAEIDLDALLQKHRDAAVVTSYIIEHDQFVSHLKSNGYSPDCFGTMITFGPRINGESSGCFCEYDFTINDMAVLAVSLLQERLNGLQGNWKVLKVKGKLSGREFVRPPAKYQEMTCNSKP